MIPARTLIVAALLLAPSYTRADDREYVIDGTVKKIDAEKQEVTIARENGKETTVKFTKGSKVMLDGKPSVFDKVKEKQEVRCVFWLESKECITLALYVEIDRPPYRGRR